MTLEIVGRDGEVVAEGDRFDQVLGRLRGKYPPLALVPGPRTSGLTEPACWRCEGRGIVLSSDDHAVPCVCRYPEIRSRRRERLARTLGAREADMVALDDLARLPSQSCALAAARRFLAGTGGPTGGPDGFLTLIGEVGTGKTAVAIAVGLALCERMETGAVLGVTATDLLESLREGYGDGQYGERWARMTQAGALILDDLAAQRDTPWADERLGQLLGERYAAGLPTVVTSNAALPALGRRVASRLLDQRYAAVAVMDGPDARRLDLSSGNGARADQGSAVTFTPRRSAGRYHVALSRSEAERGDREREVVAVCPCCDARPHLDGCPRGDRRLS